MLEPDWYFLPNDGTFSKSDLEILTVGFTSLLEQNLQREVASQNAPSTSKPQQARLDKTRGEQVFFFFLCACCDGKTNFYPAWKTIRNVIGQDSEPLLSNAWLRHSHHMVLDKFFMPQLINFSRRFSSLACFPPPWSTSSVTDEQDGDLWKC